MRGARLVAATVVALAASGALIAATFRGDAVRDARAIHREALDAIARDDKDSAFALLVEAWAADPDWLIPLVEVNRSSDHIGVALRTMAAFDSVALAIQPGDSSLQQCVHRIVGLIYDEAAARTFRSHPSQRTRRCGELLWDITQWTDAPQKLAGRYGASAFVARDHRDWLATTQPAEVLRLVRSLKEKHPIEEAHAVMAHAVALHRLGRHGEAAAVERAGDARARQLGLGATLDVLDRSRNHLFAYGSAPESSLVAHHREVSDHATTEIARLFPRLSPRTRAVRLTNEGIGLTVMGRLKESNDMLTDALRLGDSMQSVSARAYALHRRGRNLVKLGRLTEAERDLLRAREIGWSGEHMTVVSETSHDLLHLYEARGDYAAAVDAGNDFARFSRLTGATATIPMAQHDLGWLHRRQGNVAAAEAAFQRMLPDLDRTNGDFWAGEYFEYAGQLELAREHYEKASRRSPQDIGRAYAGLVRMHEALGDVAAAAQVAQIADMDTASWYPEYAPLVPGVLARRGDRRAARAQFRQARESTLRRGQMQAFAQIALESAENERWLGDPGMAVLLADSAAGAAGKVGARDLETRARAIAALARVTLAPRASSGADRRLGALDSAIRRGDAMHIPSLSAELHLLRAEALAHAGRPGDALAALARAAAWVDSTAARISADPSRAGFRSRHLAVTNQALSLLLAERGVPDRERRFAAWSARRKGGALASAWDRSAIRNIGASEAIIDYVVLDSAVGAMVVTASGVTLRTLAVTPDSLRRWIASIRGPIAPRVGSAIDRSYLGFDEAAAERLYRELVDPLLPLLGGRTKLTILPDGVLHMLPFDALVTSRVPRRYLIDDYTIAYATFVGADRRPTPPRHLTAGSAGALAVGPPGGREVAGAAEELAAVATALGRRLSVLNGPQATARAVRARLQERRVDVVHVATHAEANDANPDHARLALAADSASAGGWLHAFEIRRWELGGALVVLSACETAAGRLAGGEGTLSLSRAFLQAGARGTIATLWPIGAPTAVVMPPFYRALESGASTADALRTARLELRRAGYDHPFYWAPFVYTTNLSHFTTREDSKEDSQPSR